MLVSPFSSTVNFWMWGVANRVDSALQIGFLISRIGLLVIKLLGFLLRSSALSGPAQPGSENL